MIWAALALANPPTSTSFVGYPPGSSGDAVCVLHIVTGKTNRAEGVLVSECDVPFAKRVQKALKTWAWDPDDPAHVEEWRILFSQNAPFAKSRQIDEYAQPVDELIEQKHRSDLPLAKKALQKYPPNAEGKEATCKLELWIEADAGRVAYATIDGCEEVFHDVSFSAVYQWSFEPIDTAARWVRTKVALKYVEPPEVPPLKDWSSVLELVSEARVLVPERTRKHRPATCGVLVTVGLDGQASRAESVSGCDESLQVAAENIVRRHRFKHLGEPTPQRIVVPVHFPKKKK